MTRFRLGTRTRMPALLAAVVVSFAAVVFVAGPAQAYSCSGWRSASVNSGVSELDYSFSPSCSDGLSHISGTLYDTSCDGRQAQGTMDIRTVEWWGSFEVWFKQVSVDQGCGNYSTFSGSGSVPAQSSGQTWRVQACTWAQNFWGSSSEACSNLNQ